MRGIGVREGDTWVIVSRAAALLLLVGLLACGSEPRESTATRQPMQAMTVTSDAPGATIVHSVRIEPAIPNGTEPLRAVVSAAGPAGQPLEFEYNWSVDGRVQSATGAQLLLGGLRKGQVVEVHAVARSAGGYSEPVVARIEIPNRKPRVESVEILPPGGVSLGGELRASAVVLDPDRDSIQLRHRWLVNGEEQDATSETFSTHGLSPGDIVQVEVSAFDGEVQALARRSAPAGVLQNRAPEIVSQPGGLGGDGEFRYQLEAKDAEGDLPLRFSLLEAPKGMAIDAETGLIVWRPTADQVGATTVDVAVHDAVGSGSAQRFTLTVSGPATGDGAASPPAARR